MNIHVGMHSGKPLLSTVSRTKLGAQIKICDLMGVKFSIDQWRILKRDHGISVEEFVLAKKES